MIVNIAKIRVFTIFIALISSSCFSTESVLVTGGAGYIGSHVIVELLNEGKDVILLDKQVTKQGKNIPKFIEEIVGSDKIKKLKVIEKDMLNADDVEKIFRDNKIDAVIHLAGLKAVKESVDNPLLYYQTNIISTINLLNAMKKHDVGNLIFSSSATVYGEPSKMPIKEDFPLQAVNPYGQTKLLIEKMLMDVVKSQESTAPWHVISLRYFNPIGANEKGKLGDFQEIPANVMPYIIDVLMGRKDKFTIAGRDYNTPDKTAIRDYVHVVDLAKGHVAALEALKNDTKYRAYNLGTGQGHSVQELVDAVIKEKDSKLFKDNNLKFEYVYGDARPGDVPSSYADSSLAKKELGWEAKLDFAQMVRDSIRSALKNK